MIFPEKYYIPSCCKNTFFACIPKIDDLKCSITSSPFILCVKNMILWKECKCAAVWINTMFYWIVDWPTNCLHVNCPLKKFFCNTSFKLLTNWMPLYFRKYFSRVLPPTKYFQWVLTLVLSPGTSTKYFHQVLPLSTSTRYFHWVLLPGTSTRYFHRVRPPSTSTRFFHQVVPLGTSTGFFHLSTSSRYFHWVFTPGTSSK